MTSPAAFPRASLRERFSLSWNVAVMRLEQSRHPVARRVGRAVYWLPRFLGGARSVRTVRELADTFGFIHEAGVDIEWSGACPVQGEGTVDGREAYYRSRGEGWQFHVAGPSQDVFADDAFVYEERRYFFPDGGWVAPRVSEACIRRGVLAYRQGAGTP